MIEHVGRNVRRIRREREITQTQIARAVKISQQLLSNYEHGLRMPLPLIDRIARILGVSSDELLREPPARQHEQRQDGRRRRHEAAKVSADAALAGV